jgi:hypothetical protein
MCEMNLLIRVDAILTYNLSHSPAESSNKYGKLTQRWDSVKLTQKGERDDMPYFLSKDPEIRGMVPHGGEYKSQGFPGESR